MDHLGHHPHVVPGGGAQVVFEVALPLQLGHHVPNGRALPAYAAEPVPQSMGLTLQGIFDE